MGKVDQSEAIRKMQQVLDSKACGVISAKKLGTARSCYSARDSGVSDHLATQNPLILDNSENEHGPLYKSEGSSVPELGFRYQETCRAAKGACANLRQVEARNCSQMYILKLRNNSLLSLVLGDDETEVGRRRGKFTPDFGASIRNP